MLTKAFTGQIKEVKAEGGQGLVVAAFAKLNAVDKDHDLIMAGCFGEQKARVQGAHDWNAPNLGVASISERGDWAIAEIQYNLEIPAAKDRYESIKFSHANGLNIEYSWGYDVLEESPEAAREAGALRALRKALVREISDVVVGAGLDTHTVLVKSTKQGNIAGSWEETQSAIATAAHAALIGSSTEGWAHPVATFSDRTIVCVYKNDQEAHYWQFSWSMNGEGGVSLSNQTEVELETVIRQKSLGIDAHFSRVRVEMSDALARAKAAAAEYKEGRVLSSANRNRLSSLHEALSAAMGSISKILEDTDPEKEKAATEAAENERKAAEAAADAEFNKLIENEYARFVLHDIAPIRGENYV